VMAPRSPSTISIRRLKSSSVKRNSWSWISRKCRRGSLGMCDPHPSYLELMLRPSRCPLQPSGSSQRPGVGILGTEDGQSMRPTPSRQYGRPPSPPKANDMGRMWSKLLSLLLFRDWLSFGHFRTTYQCCPITVIAKTSRSSAKHTYKQFSHTFGLILTELKINEEKSNNFFLK